MLKWLKVYTYVYIYVYLYMLYSHIYVLLGMWMEAMTANMTASQADTIYVHKEGINNCFTGYRIHNLMQLCSQV